MNDIQTFTSQPIALAAAITLAVAAVTAMTLPETTPTAAPTAEPSGDTTTPGLTVTPAAYNGFCTAIGAVPGDPEPISCTRIPVTVMPTSYTQVAPR
ncbi:hypothetical protein QYQ98_09360 [Corynebacterium sp. P3-F1]|uniref:hypothetical protein n=1 Tax=Corynebacterium sp. P3-F1 TaxID=3059080 RepID=UPI00265D4002|nr:hypothetical protein [Corynebacterium sp. P3-F1]WKK61212.1 hypothetical protein QYQ98_09360 [Corynebacterium sp. P3-F1]